MRHSKFKKLTTLIFAATIALITTNVNAFCFNNFSDRGFYLNGQIGSGSTDFGFLDDLFSRTEIKHNQGVAGRVGVGYQVFRYLGLEGGFAIYPSATRNYNSSRSWFGYGNFSANSKITDIYGADLMAMLRLPILNYVFISAGGGVAFMHYKYDGMDVKFGYNENEGLSWQPGSCYFFSPKIVLRVGIKFNRKIAVFLSASHIFCTNGDGNINARDYQPGLSMAAIGLSYSFL